MAHDDIEALAARLSSLEKQLQSSRRQRRALTAVALAGGVLAWATVAWSDPAAPLACTHSNLYCFGAGAPALASQINSNFESVSQGVDAAAASAAAKLPLAGGTLTGPLAVTGNGASFQGGNAAGNFHIDSEGSGSDGRLYLNWYEGKGVVIANGAQTQLAAFNSPTGKTTIGGKRVPSEVVSTHCPTLGNCTATCPAGTVVKLAWGFHGSNTNVSSGSAWACGSAVQWMGACLGNSTCMVSTGCSSSSVWMECW